MGHGKVGLEAMCRGLCVVASDEGGMHDYIADQRNGLLARVGDVPHFVALVEAVLGDLGRARAMSTHAWTDARQRTWKRAAAEMLAFAEGLRARKGTDER